MRGYVLDEIFLFNIVINMNLDGLMDFFNYFIYRFSVG